MDVRYRASFLRDLKKVKNRAAYDKIVALVFEALPNADTIRAVPGVKAMASYRNRYRIRVGSFRVGIHIDGETVEIVRALDRRDFYRYFP